MITGYSLLILATFALIGMLIVLFKGWRPLVLLVLIWMVFDALPRRYVLNDLSWTIGKEVWIAFVYAGYLMEHVIHRHKYQIGGPSFLKPFLVSFMALAGWVIVGGFSPRSPSLVVAAYGVWVWLWHIPLLWIGMKCFLQEEQLWSFLRFYVIISIVPLIIGLIQANLPIDHPLNKTYLGFLPLVGQRLRSPGTFASNAAFSDYIFFIGSLTLILMLTRKIRSRLGMFIMVLIVLEIAATAQALLLGGWLIVGAMILLLTQRRALVIGLVVIATLFTVLATEVSFLKAYESGYARILRLFDVRYVEERLRWHFFDQVKMAFIEAGFIGYGPGYNSKGVGYLQEVGVIKIDWSAAESGYGKIVREVGIVGLFIFLWFMTVLTRTVSLWKRFYDDTRVFGVVVTAWCVTILVWLLIIQKLDQPTFAIPFWFFLGTYFGLLRRRFGWRSPKVTLRAVRYDIPRAE